MLACVAEDCECEQPPLTVTDVLVIEADANTLSLDEGSKENLPPIQKSPHNLTLAPPKFQAKEPPKAPEIVEADFPVLFTDIPRQQSPAEQQAVPEASAPEQQQEAEAFLQNAEDPAAISGADRRRCKRPRCSRICCCKCCGVCHAGGVLFLIVSWIITGTRDWCDFIPNDEIENYLLLPPSSYPEPLKGMLWLDTHGAYGFTNQSSTEVYDDLVVTWMDFAHQLDTETRTLDLPAFGISWTFFNSGNAFATWWGATYLVHIFYKCTFNEDYSFAEIVPNIRLLWVIYIPLPKSVVTATIHLQTPKPGECPPADGATKEQISKCAKWRRETRTMGGDPTVYYVYEIANQSRKRVQPYYDAYLEFANSKSIGNAFAAGFFLGPSVASNMLPQSQWVR